MSVQQNRGIVAKSYKWRTAYTRKKQSINIYEKNEAQTINHAVTKQN